MRLGASLFSFFVVASGFAARDARATERRELGKSASYFVFVSKQSNELSLRSFEEPSKVLQTYHAITGANLGDKRVEGDRKTPEGIYFVTRKLPASRLTALHGAAAFELNYPNPLDRHWKHTGSGIWIHGVDDEKRLLKRFDTLGCVALSNKEVTELGERLEFGLTPVVIVDSEDPAKPAGYLPLSSPLGQRLEAWAKAWSTKDQDAYISFYHPEFRSRGMDLAAWDKYKRRLAKNYKDIEVTLSNVTLLRHPKYSVALFHQSYRSDRFQADSDKVVYWVGEGADAKILAEVVAAENAGPLEAPAQGDDAVADAPALGKTSSDEGSKPL
jgi:murein L,D-transpeptidase YafK